MGATPAMQQFQEIKNQYPDCLVLFRMGDFYETFYEDAVLASRVLGITLTQRGFKASANKIPLAGLPYHAIDNYLPKLVKAGVKTVIVEQLEDPKKAKGIVKRGVTRIVTPGTIIEPHILNAGANNYLVCLWFGKWVGLSYVDLSTGEYCCTELSEKDLVNEIIRLRPAEILCSISQSKHALAEELRKLSFIVNDFSDRFFLKDQAQDTLFDHFRVASLRGFGLDGKEHGMIASGALMQYLYETQKSKLSYLHNLHYYTTSQFMLLDSQTVKHLELVTNQSTQKDEHTLLWTLNETQTPMGARLLRKWVLAPLVGLREIKERQECVESLVKDSGCLYGLKDHLKSMRDVERLMSKIAYGSANPKDLVSLRESFALLPLLIDELRDKKEKLLREVATMPKLNEFFDLLSNGIKDEPPTTVREGGMIKSGYHKELDEFWKIKTNTKQIILDLEAKERERTGIKNLKIGFNKVFGYFFEVTKVNLHLVPEDYIRKQTRVTGERFITQELKVLEEKILGVEEKIVDLEYRIFIEITDAINKETKNIQRVAHAVGMLDVFVSFALVAIKNSYVAPELHDGFDLSVVGGRHPVLEQTEEVFIPNDYTITQENRTMIITGPNMAGKSTVMRQLALISLMAQMGSFVPATSARLPVVDRVFTRIGASDDLTTGQSTFMMEMNGVSLILNNATERSLILMDEIGRGTSTFDGVSIAWSVAAYLNNEIKGKTLFATHYHVLTKLDRYAGIKNYNIAVAEENDRIVFLRTLKEGGTDKSYGVHVAKLAGMPPKVIRHAQEIQARLEGEDRMEEDVHTKEPVKSNGRKPKFSDGDVVAKVKSQKTLFDMGL